MTTEAAGPCKTPIHFDGRTFVCGGKHATDDHAKVVADEILATQPVAPSITEEPKSPIVDPKAASQKEGSKTACGVCGRAISECRACWEAGGDAEDAVCNRLGYERQRAEIEKLKAEVVAARYSPLGDNHHNAAQCPYCGDPLRAAQAEVARLTKGRDEARKIHTDYMKGQEPEERDWAAAFTDSAAAMVLQAFGRIRPPDGSAPTYQSFNEYQSRALDALKKALLREEPFSAEGRAVLARADAALADAKALREALAEIVTHVDPDRMRVVAYAALAPPNPSAEKLTPTVAPAPPPKPLAEQEQIK